MKNFIKIGSILSLFLMLSLVFQGCTKKDPSIIKVFVRSSNNTLLQDAKVVIVADVNSDPPTAAYVDTLMTNSAGFASFDMAAFFGEKPKKGSTGYFDIIARKEGKEGIGRIRCRAYITNVETVFLEE
jgi:hypothetical protein